MFTHWTETMTTGWAAKHYTCHNQKFIQDDLDKTRQCGQMLRLQSVSPIPVVAIDANVKMQQKWQTFSQWERSWVSWGCC